MSGFHRPWGSPPPQPSRAARLAQDWETLEAQVAQQPHAAAPRIGEFLRRWGVEICQAPAAEQGALTSLLESARRSLWHHVESYQQETQRRLWEAQNAQREQLEQQRYAEQAQQQRQRHRDELARLQSETWQAQQEASDRQHRAMRAALFPEQFCPHCSGAWLLSPDGHRTCRCP